MLAPLDGRRFAYALVSAAPLPGTGAAGIGIVFKAADRSTVHTVCLALPGKDCVSAAYEAMMRVLDEALQIGLKRLTVYTDVQQITGQLADDVEVPRPLLVAHLKTRGMINQLGGVQIVAATSDRFSARLLAERARLPIHGSSVPSGQSHSTSASLG